MRAVVALAITSGIAPDVWLGQDARLLDTGLDLMSEQQQRDRRPAGGGPIMSG